MLEKDLAYQVEAPTLWDVDLPAPRWPRPRSKTARRRGAYHQIAFPTGRATGPSWIDTTRPELIPACVALVAHPDDERYRPLFGRTVDDAALRRRGSGAAPRARRARQGHRHRR